MDTDYKELAMYLANRMHKWFKYDAGYGYNINYKAVIGISGGKDSAVAAAIACEAIGKENVYGVLMPNGEQADIADSEKVCRFLDIKWGVCKIDGPYVAMLAALNVSDVDIRDREKWWNPDKFESDTRVTTNLPARLRMCALYSIAARINGRVIGTGNFSEAIAGYTTLWGDSACDYNPLASLYADEVVEVGRALGDLPEEVLTKPPADGMSGKTDEDNLGFTYAELKAVMRRTGTEVPSKYDEVMKRATAASFKRRLLIGIPHPSVERHLDGSIDMVRTMDAWNK